MHLFFRGSELQIHRNKRKSQRLIDEVGLIKVANQKIVFTIIEVISVGHQFE